MTGSELSYPAIRLAVVKAAQALVASGVVSHSGPASLSARVGDEKMLLTMEGQVRALRPDRLALVGLDRTVLEGDLDPASAEIVAIAFGSLPGHARGGRDQVVDPLTDQAGLAAVARVLADPQAG